MRRAVPTLLVAAVVALSFALAACGDDKKSSDTGSTSTPATADAGGAKPVVTASAAAALKEITGEEPLTGAATVDELTPRVAKYTAVPSKLLETEPVSKKAEPGKTLAVLVCGVPVCTEFNNAVGDAAKLLGWKVEKIDLGVSPEDFTKAYDRAIELKPDMVIGSGLPRELFAKQLDTLQEMNIPVIEWSSGIKPVPDHLWVAVDDPLYEATGLMFTEWLAADGDLKANTVAYSVPQYPMPEIMVKTMKDYFPGACPDCKFDVQEVAVTDIGKLGPKVTGYVQQNPDVKYVLCAFGDLCQGVGQALKAAGRDDIKVITRDTSTTNLQNMANGLEKATVPLPIGQTGWQIVDLAQRIFNKDDTANTRLSPIQIVTDVPDPKSTTVGAVPDYQDQYKALWQLGG